MSLARNLSKFKPSSSGLVETADIADDAVSTDQIANDAVISTSGAITTTGAFTSVGIDDNADATTITIDSSERVGIGTTSPSHQLHIESSGSNSYATMKLEGQNRGGQIDMFQNTVITNQILGDQSGNLYFNTSGAFGNTSATTKLTLGTAGDLTVNSGNLVIGTSGKGIDFSAQTAATGDGTQNPTTENEVLKNYEHGTFNPKVVASGVTFDYQGSGGQYGSGHYTRIGDIVFIDINLDSDGGCSGSTGNDFTVTNMPFSNNTGTSLNVTYFYRRVSSSSYPHQMCSIYNTTISFLRSPNSGQWDGIPASDINFTDHRMKISGCYHIG